MLFSKGPSEIVLDGGHKAVKVSKKEFFTYIQVLPGESKRPGCGIRWFDYEVAPLRWKTNLFAFKTDTDPYGDSAVLEDGVPARTYALLVHAPSKDELTKRVKTITSIDSDLVTLVLHDRIHALEAHQKIASSGVLSVCAQKEGGLS